MTRGKWQTQRFSSQILDIQDWAWESLQTFFFFSREWKSNHCVVSTWVQDHLAVFFICLWTSLIVSGPFKTRSWEWDTRHLGWVDQSRLERTTASWDPEWTILLRQLRWTIVFKQLTSHCGIFYTSSQLKALSLIPHENLGVLVTCTCPIFSCLPDTGHCGWPLIYWKHTSLTNCISIFPTPIPVSEIIHSEQVNRALGSKAAEKNLSQERKRVPYYWGKRVSHFHWCCHSLSPLLGDSVIQPPLLTLAGKHSHTGSDYSHNGGGETNAFLLLMRLREVVYHFWVGWYPSAKNDLLTLRKALRAVIGEIIAYAECKEKMPQRNGGL